MLLLKNTATDHSFFIARDLIPDYVTMGARFITSYLTSHEEAHTCLFPIIQRQLPNQKPRDHLYGPCTAWRSCRRATPRPFIIIIELN